MREGHGSQEARHLLGYPLMRVAAEHVLKPGRPALGAGAVAEAARFDRGGKESLLGGTKALQCIFDALNMCFADQDGTRIMIAIGQTSISFIKQVFKT